RAGQQYAHVVPPPRRAVQAGIHLADNGASIPARGPAAPPARNRPAMADSTDTPPPKPSGLGRRLSRRQAMAGTPPSAHAAPAPVPAPVPDAAKAKTSHGHGAAPLQRVFGSAHGPEALLHAFAEGMSTLPGELGDLGRLLHSAHDR